MTDPTEARARTMNLRDEILKYTNNPANQPVSMQEIAQYAQSLHARDVGGMCVLLADIREAAGDAEGRLMQPELVERISSMRESLREFVEFQISDYHKSSDAARRYREIRRAAVKAMGGRS